MRCQGQTRSRTERVSCLCVLCKQVYDPLDPQGSRDPSPAPVRPADSNTAQDTDHAPDSPEDAPASPSTKRRQRRAGKVASTSLAGAASFSGASTASSSAAAAATAPSVAPDSAAAQAQKFVADVSKTMERVKAGQVALEKIRAALGMAQATPGTMPAYDPLTGGGHRTRRTGRGGTNRSADEHLVQVR